MQKLYAFPRDKNFKNGVPVYGAVGVTPVGPSVFECSTCASLPTGVTNHAKGVYGFTLLKSKV